MVTLIPLAISYPSESLIDILLLHSQSNWTRVTATECCYAPPRLTNG